MKKLNGLLTVVILMLANTAWAGEFSNYCTNGLFTGVLQQTDCAINELYKGKTYCFSSDGARDSFLRDQDNMIAKATTVYTSNTEPEREKISQADALSQINSKTCTLQNKDAGYLIFNGLDLSHCNLQNVSFFWCRTQRCKIDWCKHKRCLFKLSTIGKC